MRLPHILVDILEALSECSPPQNLSPEKIFHVVVAPCYDKKLEALREGLSTTLNGARGTDCVLTSGESWTQKVSIPLTLIIGFSCLK